MLSFAEGPEGLLSPFVERVDLDVDVAGGPLVTEAIEGMIVVTVNSGTGRKKPN